MQTTMQYLKKGHLIHNVYCATAEQTIAACEEEFTQFQHQQVLYFEVPFDQFDTVKRNFRQPDLVKQGAFTYKQVQHIVQTGNIHQLLMNDEGRLYFTEDLIGMSTAISFAQSKWNGAPREKAVENAVVTGMSIIGEAFAEEVIDRQLQVEEISKQISLDISIRGAIAKSGTKAGLKKVASAATKKAMYSSALAKKAIMVLNANVVTGALVTGVMSSVDIARTIKGQMSPAQLVKNMSTTVASVGGSIAGLMIGSGIGWSSPTVSPTVSSIIGGIVGLALGSVLMTKLAKGILNILIKDDALQMLEVFQEQLAIEAEAYLLNQQELNQVINDFNELYNMQQELRNMYAAHNREAYARQLINQELSRIVKLRMYLQTPTNQELFQAMERLQYE